MGRAVQLNSLEKIVLESLKFLLKYNKPEDVTLRSVERLYMETFTLEEIDIAFQSLIDKEILEIDNRSNIVIRKGWRR